MNERERKMPAASFEKVFSRTLSHPEARAFMAQRGVRELCSENPDRFSARLREMYSPATQFAFLADLADVEYAFWNVGRMEKDVSRPVHGAVINPMLQLVPVDFDVSPFFEKDLSDVSGEPERHEGFLVVWKGPGSGAVHVEKADDQVLLALKVLAEDLLKVPEGQERRIVNMAVDYAARKGIVIKAPYLVSRQLQEFPEAEHMPDRFKRASTFTLQWHITNICDLHCRHCYDRENRVSLTLDEGRAVIDDFERFCSSMNVGGHICFSGGNPFLSPHFYDWYREAAERGFHLSLLGNPVEEEQMRRVIDMSKPEYFQVSLEGLETHNDQIRGEGFYRKVLEFLSLLKEKQVSSAVMLTLTKANIEEVLPLTEVLRDSADYFTFNRLSQVGEGAALSLPESDRFRSFLESYTLAARTNPVIGFKDNLFNILREKDGVAPFGGCTGFGCGAAFNFVALLPDGEVHACRKFPSPIGNILESDFMSLYESVEAKRYRRGPEPCMECRLRTVCGGCMAVVHGMGLDPFRDKDPYCFLVDGDADRES